MNYGKKGTIAGFRFKKSYADYQTGKPATRAYNKRKLPAYTVDEDVVPTEEQITKFKELVAAINPELADEITLNGLPKQVFLSADIYYKVKAVFEVFPLRVVKHRHLDTRSIRLTWCENKFIKPSNKKS